MKKKLFLCLMAVGAIVMVGCKDNQSAQLGGPCVIKGTISPEYNGKRIFLVPMEGPKTAEYVDSMEVANGQFEFKKDSVMMAKIVMDYHYRMNLQPLLVVTEGGVVNVHKFCIGNTSERLAASLEGADRAPHDRERHSQAADDGMPAQRR